MYQHVKEERIVSFAMSCLNVMQCINSEKDVLKF